MDGGQFTTCAKLPEYTLVLERILASEATLPFEDRTLQFDAENLAILTTYGRSWKRIG